MGSKIHPHLPELVATMGCNVIACANAKQSFELNQLRDIQQEIGRCHATRRDRKWGVIADLLYRASTIAYGCLPWLQRLTAMHRLTPTHLDVEGNFVYLIVNSLDSNVYVGCTKRNLLTRFKEHIWAAEFSLRTHIRRWTKRNLWQYMAKHGVENFMMFPLQSLGAKCCPEALYTCERRWIRKFFERGHGGHLLNVDTGRADCRVDPLTLKVVSSSMGEVVMSSKLASMLGKHRSIAKVLDHCLQLRRVELTAEDLLLMANMAHGQVMDHKWKAFWKFVVERFKLWHLRLPVQLVISVPRLASQQFSETLKRCLYGHIDNLAVHRHLAVAYKHLITLVRKVPTTARRLLAKPVNLAKYVHVSHMREALKGTPLCMCRGQECRCGSGCSCDKLQSWCDPQHYSSHILRKSSDLYCLPLPHVFKKSDIEVLQQSLTNEVVLSAEEYVSVVVKSVVKCNRKLQGCVGRLAFTLSEVRGAILPFVQPPPSTPPHMFMRNIITTKKKLPHGIITGQLDKNSAVLWLGCWKLIANVLYQQFFCEKQLVPVQEGLDGLVKAFSKAVAPLVKKYCPRRSQSCCDDIKILPVLYLLVKDKPMGILKLRPITSHRLHPLKPYARLIGRALSVLILYSVSTERQKPCFMRRNDMVFFPQCARLIPSLDCPLMDLFVPFVKWFREVWPSQCYPSMVELDLDNMYSNIDKKEAFIAVCWFLDTLWKKWRRHWVAISLVDRKLDRIGMGAARDFRNFSFESIRTFVEFDIFENNLVHCGELAFKQCVGLPMGGCLSAQLACIYCIYREHQRFEIFSELSLTSTAHMSRFRDNVFIFFDSAAITVEALLDICKETYNMGVKIEHRGRVIDTLSFRLSMDVNCDSVMGPVHLRLKPVMKGKLSGPDPQSPNMKSFVRSYVPQCVLKAIRCTEFLLLQAIALCEQLEGLILRGYPIHLLRDRFLAVCRRHTVREELRLLGMGVLSKGYG